MYLRLVTSAQIRTDPQSYADFLFHPETGAAMEPRDFCERFVEASGKEAGSSRFECMVIYPVNLTTHRSCPDNSALPGASAQY